MVNELFFECYNVAGVAYGVDSAFSYHHNVPPAHRKTGLIISSGYQNTHVLPVIDSKFQLVQARRVNIGGLNHINFLQRLIQLKNPSLAKHVTYWNSEQLCHRFCYYTPNYMQDLRSLKDRDLFRQFDRVIQFPFTQDTLAEVTEEEKQRIANTRKAQGMRLKERLDQKREEKIKDQEKELQELRELKKGKKDADDEDDYDETLKIHGFDSEKQLDELIVSVEAKLKKFKNKMAGIAEPEDPKEPPSFPLVDVPDAQLTPEQIKEKRKQKLMKAGYDARIRQRQEKDVQRQREEEETRLDDQHREANLERWLENTRAKRQGILDKIKERKKLKEQLSDRRSAASQSRMKTIAGLADDTGIDPIYGPKPRRKRKRKNDEDTFGADDEDWEVYKDLVHSSLLYLAFSPPLPPPPSHLPTLHR